MVSKTMHLKKIITEDRICNIKYIFFKNKNKFANIMTKKLQKRICCVHLYFVVMTNLFLTRACRDVMS